MYHSASSDIDKSGSSNTNGVSTGVTTSNAATNTPLESNGTGGSSNDLTSEQRRQKKRKQTRQRRELLRELLKTEKNHVKNLRLLDHIFYHPLKSTGELLNPDELNTLFMNHTKLLALHTRINEKLKASIRPVLKRGSSLGGGQQAVASALGGGPDANNQQHVPLPTHKQMCAELVALFEGELGEELCRESAEFCCR